MSHIRIKFVARVMPAFLLFMVTIFYSRAQSCVTGISTNTLNFSSGSDCEDVYVDLYPEWCDTWMGITYEEWITPYEDYDFGTLVICVDEHTESSEPRVGYVYIGSYTITVTQSGVCALPDAPSGISGLSTRYFNFEACIRVFAAEPCSDAGFSRIALATGRHLDLRERSYCGFRVFSECE